MSVGLSRDEFKQLANAQRAHIRQLEQLCRDMYDALIANHGGYVTVLTLEEFGERMQDLGLLGVVADG